MRILKIFFSLVFLLGITFSPLSISAETFGECMSRTGGNYSSCSYLQNSSGETVGESSTITIENPLKTKTITGLFDAVLNFIWTLALIIAPIIVVYAGILIVISAGNETKLKKAWQTLMWALIGFAIIALSKGIVAIIRGIVES